MAGFVGTLVVVTTVLSSTMAFPREIHLGVLNREGEDEDAKGGVYTAVMRHNRNSSRVLYILQWKTGVISRDQIDALNSMKIMCKLLRQGFFVLLAAEDLNIPSAFSSVSKRFQIPFINWASSPRNNSSNPFEVSIYPPMEEIIADLLIAKKWDDYVYVYSTTDGPLRSILIDQYAQSKGKRPSRILLDELPTNSSELKDYFTKLREKFRRNRTIIDANGPVLYEVMNTLKENANMTEHMHFIIASYEVNETDMEVFKSGNVNMTILNVLRPWSHALRDLRTFWRTANATLLGGEKTQLSLKAALGYDSVFVAVTALNNILLKENPDAFQHNFRRGEFYNEGTYRGIWCDVTKDKENPNRVPPDKFEHGQRIARHLKMVQMEGVTGRIEFDETGRRKNYFVEINDVEFSDNILSVMHTVWKDGVGMLTDQARVSYKRTQDDRGQQTKKTFIITSVIREPFLMEKENFSSYNGSNDGYEGFCVDLIKTLSTRIRKEIEFEYEIRIAPDGNFGAKRTNGTWDGMIGELLKGRADIAVAPLTITKAREAVIDFSKPFLVTGLSIMIKRPEAEQLSVFSFMQPLSIEVWMYIIFAYLGISVVIFLVSRFSPYEWRVEETTQGTFTISNDFSVYNCLWFTLAAFMQQGIDILPRSVSGRIASSAWWFFTMIIVSSYTANLAAFLTLEKMNAPIESADDLAKQTKIKYGIQRSGSSAEFFSNSTVQVYQRMWQYMKSQVQDVFEDNYTTGIERVRRNGGRYAFILEESHSEYMNKRKPCDTMKVGSNLNSIGYGIGTPFGSELKARLNLAILELQENGELGNLYHRWWVKNSEGQCPQVTQEGGNSLTQDKVAGIFYILIGGMVVSLVAAFIELLYRSRLEAQKSQKTISSSMKAQLAMTMKGEQGRRVVHVQPPDSSDAAWPN